MSGHKLSTLRIQKSAAARITRQRIKNILLEEQNQSRNARLRDEYIADMDKVFHKVESRQSHFNDTLDGFQSRTLRRMEQENNAALINSQAALYENMHSLVNQLWLETDTALSNEVEQTLTEIEGQHRDMEDIQMNILFNQNADREESKRLAEQFNHSQQQVANAFLDFESRQAEIADNQRLMFQQVQDYIQQQEELGRFKESKEEIVYKQLADADTLYDFIINTFDHEKFTPGQAQRAAYELGKARQNLEQGFLDAAMVNAQQAYQSLSEQRTTLQQRQAEWDLLYLDVDKKLHQLLADAEGLKEIPSTDLDGNEIGQMIDVDYWASRRLSRLTTMLHTRINQVNTQAEELQTIDLLNIQQQELPRLFEELENTCSLAMEEALNSQLRVNIADIVIHALEDQGFCFSESAYQQNDLRKAYSANVTNLAGDEIIIGVEPNKGEPGSSDLHLITPDADQYTTDELVQRAKEIFSTLNQFGLENEEIQILQDEWQDVHHHNKHND